ncbi:prion-inhibition and propagation-domain-containing protein [Parachaetomium inaequale]|uniref:Prion-inhibition and propagation-domain-containing protein n=1 Tax=Parachaetomium inaequale TaxID=2588326 RepID=A0AAN6SNM4_9PEZI|nr:prion-inhibition and propagation-domain-containing protein [Parachaetomium inaequale]
MEPIGLAVGVAGLAGLFSTCIECFNIVQRGRYLGRDYFILETKYTNQRLRLLTWGRACGLTDAGTPAAEGWDEDILTAVSRTLAQIALLFQDHQALRKRYGLSPERSGLGGRVSNTQAILNALTSGFRDTSLAISEAAVFPPLPRSPAKGPSISAAVRWAVDDKRTFAELVDHLKDFIDGLEGVTAGLNVPQRQREMIRVEVGHISDFSELEMIEEARMGNSDAVADAASLRLCQLQDTASVVPAAGPPIARGPVTTPGSPLPKETIHSVDPDWDMVEPTMAQSTGSTDSCYVTNGEYILDEKTYDYIHIHDKLPPRGECREDGHAETQEGLIPHEPKSKDDWWYSKYMRHTLPGFHLRNHVWRELLVRAMEPVSWPDAKIEDALIGEEARGQPRKMLGPMEKPNWERRNDGPEDGGLTRIILSFQGTAMESAINAASRITRRPLYRIRLLNQTEKLDETFREAKCLNMKWGCIFVIEDLLEACATHTQGVVRLNPVILPLLWFLDNMTGILVFLLSEDASAGDPYQSIDPKIRQRICKHFRFPTQDTRQETREELWKECIKDRLSSGDDFSTDVDDVAGKLKKLAELPLTWDAIRSTVHAVVPKGTAVSNINWEIIAELTQERPETK